MFIQDAHMFIVADTMVLQDRTMNVLESNSRGSWETIVNFNGKNYLGRQWEFPRENYIPRTTHY